MPNELKSQTFAQGRVSAAGASLVSGTRNWTSVRSAAGIYVITWVGSQIDPSNAIYKVWARGDTASLRQSAKVSTQAGDVVDASFTVRTYDAAGAAADCEFDFEVSRLQF
jgi:hypothetical protein